MRKEADKIELDIRNSSDYKTLLEKVYRDTLEDAETRLNIVTKEHIKHIKHIEAIEEIRKAVIASAFSQQNTEMILMELFKLRNEIMEMNVKNIRAFLEAIFELDKIMEPIKNKDYLIVKQIYVIRGRLMKGLSHMRVEEFTISANETFDYEKHELEFMTDYNMEVEGRALESCVRSGFKMKGSQHDLILCKAIVRLK